MKLQIFLLTVAISLLTTPLANGAGAISGGESAGSNCEDYYHQGVLAIAGLDAGDLEVWSKIPGCGKARSNTEVLQWAGRMAAPVPTGTTVVAFAWAFSGVSGCTATTPTVLSDVGAAGSSSGATATLTMTSNECHAIMTATYTITVATIMVYQARPQFAIDIQVEQPNQMYLCNASGLTDNAFNPSGSSCTTPGIDNQNRICDDSALFASCTELKINADVKTRFCDASDYNTTCNRAVLAYLNYWCAQSGTALSTFSITANICVQPSMGTQHIVLDSLPTINIAGSLTTTIAAWPNLSVGITSWPGLNIASIPTITVNDQVHILDSVTLHHILDSGTLTVNGINVNQTVGNVTVSFPRELALQICGPNFINTSVCSPVEVNASATVDGTKNISMLFPFLIFLLLIIWAEISRQFELYIIAVIVGGLAVMTLWAEITGMRAVLIAILAFLCFRGYLNYKDDGDE